MFRSKPVFTSSLCYLVATLVFLFACGTVNAQQEMECNRTIIAKVVALDQPFMWNRLGTAQPQGMIFALERDVVTTDGDNNPANFKPGYVRLRKDKRARPIVLRAAVGDCLEIHFTNLLNPTIRRPFERSEPSTQLKPKTRDVGIEVMGLELRGSIESDGSWVGTNANSFAKPGETKIYKYYARANGTFLLHSLDDNQNGQLAGLFGAVNVQPKGAQFFRSQVTREDLKAASTGQTSVGQPIIKSEKTFPFMGGPATARQTVRQS